MTLSSESSSSIQSKQSLTYRAAPLPLFPDISSLDCSELCKGTRKHNTHAMEVTESHMMDVLFQLFITSALILSYHLEWSVLSKTTRLRKSTLLFFSFLRCLYVTIVQ